MSLKIILADDHTVVRHGVSSLLRSLFEDLEIKTSQDFTELIPLLHEFDAQILLLDINISGGNSIAMIDKVRKANPKIYILMFSAYEESNYALRYIHAGANGFLSKEASEEEIAKAINTLLKTGKYISNIVKEKILENVLQNAPMDPLEVLSIREIEVADLLIKGLGVLEISNQLNIQTTTVSTYKNRIFEKLKITNIVSLVEIFNIYRN